MSKYSTNIICLFVFLILTACSDNLSQVDLFEDGFDQLPIGVLSAASDTLAEYYYLSGAGQKGNWTITSFGREKGYQTAWEILEVNGEAVLRQNFSNTGSTKNLISRHSHPAIVAGDSIWTNYSVRFTFTPYELMDKCGIMFRYQNDRCYYFFGMEGNMLMVKLIQHATAPYRPFEKVLASRSFNWQAGSEYEGYITLRDDKIYVQVNDSINLVAIDDTYQQGKIGLLSDVKANFNSIKVSMLKSEKRKLNRHRNQIASQMMMRLNENTDAVLLDSISTDDFGSGNMPRFGDLNMDGETDIVLVQHVKNGGDSRIACLTAMTTTGEILWQNGTPLMSNQLPVEDFPMQIHDINGDGSREVIYISESKINILKGESGKRIRRRVSLPGALRVSGRKSGKEKSIFFCDLQGKGRDSDMIVIDGGGMIYAYNERMRLLWSNHVDNASYPAAEDIDFDGKDEIATGYSLIDHDGSVIWDVKDQYGSRVKEIAIVSPNPSADSTLKIVYGAGDWGSIVLDQSGEKIVHHPIGNIQSISIGNFRNDLQGLEMVTSNFWGSQGIINLYDSQGEIYQSLEPGPFGSQCLPVNWRGDGEEYFLLNASSGDGGLYDGYGKLVVVLPDDGHPDLSNVVLDIYGDSRDEIITWDQKNIWIYTQGDNPRKGVSYKPIRSPGYNTSLHQSMVSIPDWD